MKIIIELRNVYGLTKAYPACSAADQFAAIAGTKTLTRHTLSRVLALGYSILVPGRGGCEIMPGSTVHALTLSE